MCIFDKVSKILANYRWSPSGISWWVSPLFAVSDVSLFMGVYVCSFTTMTSSLPDCLLISDQFTEGYSLLLQREVINWCSCISCPKWQFYKKKKNALNDEFLLMQMQDTMNYMQGIPAGFISECYSTQHFHIETLIQDVHVILFQSLSRNIREALCEWITSTIPPGTFICWNADNFLMFIVWLECQMRQREEEGGCKESQKITRK